jgi:hypothetical protein
MSAAGLGSGVGAVFWRFAGGSEGLDLGGPDGRFGRSSSVSRGNGVGVRSGATIFGSPIRIGGASISGKGTEGSRGRISRGSPLDGCDGFDAWGAAYSTGGACGMPSVSPANTAASQAESQAPRLQSPH